MTETVRKVELIFIYPRTFMQAKVRNFTFSLRFSYEAIASDIVLNLSCFTAYNNDLVAL